MKFWQQLFFMISLGIATVGVAIGLTVVFSKSGRGTPVKVSSPTQIEDEMGKMCESCRQRGMLEEQEREARKRTDEMNLDIVSLEGKIRMLENELDAGRR